MYLGLPPHTHRLQRSDNTYISLNGSTLPFTTTLLARNPTSGHSFGIAKNGNIPRLRETNKSEGGNIVGILFDNIHIYDKSIRAV
jgi:hypothetical protein